MYALFILPYLFCLIYFAYHALQCSSFFGIAVHYLLFASVSLPFVAQVSFPMPHHALQCSSFLQ
jgi:hypothetical protein